MNGTIMEAQSEQRENVFRGQLNEWLLFVLFAAGGAAVAIARSIPATLCYNKILLQASLPEMVALNLKNCASRLPEQ